MQAKTELLLYQLLWLGSQIKYPTFHSLSSSFESWAYSKGLLQILNRLEHERYLETQGKSLDRVIRLTEKGRQLLAGGRNPEIEWAREWNGTWRMVIFDIPESKRALRRELRNILKACHFGCFQQSVWLSPHPMASINDLLRKTTPGLSNLTLMECHLLPGENDSDVVKGAWDFSRINGNYQTYIKHIKNFGSQKNPKNIDRFISEEKLLWETALKYDPLLPKQLTPRGYLGKKAHQLRMTKLHKIMNSAFKHLPESSA
ncbi:MAG: hypothetical protein GXP30_04210 [Verrucomicrobia bacterium]|nr:hypothetical protein [Verrucomicrobiota bacterium]